MRKRILPYFAFFLLITLNIHAQNLWRPTGGPYALDITQVVCKPGGYVFMATLSSGIYRSTDNGNTWKDISNGIDVINGINC